MLRAPVIIAQLLQFVSVHAFHGSQAHRHIQNGLGPDGGDGRAAHMLDVQHIFSPYTQNLLPYPLKFLVPCPLMGHKAYLIPFDSFHFYSFLFSLKKAAFQPPFDLQIYRLQNSPGSRRDRINA